MELVEFKENVLTAVCRMDHRDLKSGDHYSNLGGRW